MCWPPCHTCAPALCAGTIAIRAVHCLWRQRGAHAAPGADAAFRERQRARRVPQDKVPCAFGSVIGPIFNSVIGNALTQQLGTALEKRFPSMVAAKHTSRFAGGERFNRAKCYEGKENAEVAKGAFGPGMYDVRCSKTGSPRGEAKHTPRFAGSERFTRAKCYEGKENAEVAKGIYGPGMYDVQCSKTGSPLKAKGSPRFAGSERFTRAKCYEGRENANALRGQAGASGLDSPRCSNRGSPLWNRRREPSAAFAIPYVPKLRREIMSARE